MKNNASTSFETIPVEVQHSVSIQAEKNRIYHCISTVEGWNAWFTSAMSLDARPGGRIIFHWKNWGAEKISGGDHGELIDLIPDEKISFTWHPDQPDYTTTVELNITGSHSPYVVHVTEFGFADTLQGMHAMVRSAAGWGEALTLMKMYLEYHISLVEREP